MKYFIDTEFKEDGKTIELISIGLVAEDGRTLYLENAEFDWSKVPSDAWLQSNVRRSLIPFYQQSTRKEIADLILNFIGPDDKVEFWGYFADYDWVVFCQLFGSMLDLPHNLPMFCMDLMQLQKEKGVRIKQEGSRHNALDDALWIKRTYETLNSY